MMFERFTPEARHVVVHAQDRARRFGHGYIGCEHLLLGAASTSEPASAVLWEHGVTPERVEAEILRITGRADAADPVDGIDRDALAAIGIDLDVVRERVEAVFGPGALARAAAAAAAGRADRAARAPRRSRRPAWGKGPVAELMRRRRGRRATHNVRLAISPGQRPSSDLAQMPVGPPPPGQGALFAGPSPRGHIPFTPRAKKSLALSLREAQALHDNYIGVQHVTLGLLAMRDGMVPVILSAIGIPAASLRAAIPDRYRKSG